MFQYYMYIWVYQFEIQACSFGAFAFEEECLQEWHGMKKRNKLCSNPEGFSRICVMSLFGE